MNVLRGSEMGVLTAIECRFFCFEENAEAGTACDEATRDLLVLRDVGSES